MKPAIIKEPELVKKGWGYEHIIHNGDGYCFKILSFKAGSSGSLHFHKEKTETWYIKEGELKITTIDPKTAYREVITVIDGAVIHLPAGTPHKVEAITDVLIFEASTPHRDDDTYRIEPGDSQK